MTPKHLRPTTVKAHAGVLLKATLLPFLAFQAVAGEIPNSKSPLPPVAPSISPLSFDEGRWVFDVQERIRFEVRENNYDFNDAINGPQDASWLLQRFRLGILYAPEPWLKFYIQGQDIREIGGSRPNEVGVLGAEGDDTFDLLKAFVDIGDSKQGPSARVGRQFLSFGDQRLVGPLEWLNQARTFDAAKLRYAAPTWSLDLFVSSPVTAKDHMWNQSDFTDTDESRNSVFSGAYLSTTWVPWQSVTDFYFFNKIENKLSAAATAGPPLGFAGDTNFYTVGTLMKGDPKKLHGWDYSTEMAFQFGKVAELDHTAFAGNWGIGYNFNGAWKPRIGVQYSYATGDRDPTDGRSETFQNLYPTNHPYYGLMDTASWQNVHDPEINFSISPTPKLKLMADYHAFWNASNDDAWYRANGVTAVRPLNAAARNASHFRGQEVDLTAIYKCGARMSVQAGYSVFFAGSYLADTGPSDNAHFGYLQVQLDF